MELSEFFKDFGALVVLASFFATLIGVMVTFLTLSRSDWHSCNATILAIREDIRDFHGRLCTIEERYREAPRNLPVEKKIRKKKED